jgi:hypothetical protein
LVEDKISINTKPMKQKPNYLAVTLLEYGFSLLTAVLGLIFFGRFAYALLFNQ